MYNRFEQFSLAIAEISRHWHKLTSDEMEPYGLKGVHGIYLLVLARYEDGLTATRLCEICCRDKSDVSRMMKIMEEKRLVSKDGEYQNRYAGVYSLTEKGTEVAQHIRARASMAVEIAGSELTDGQRKNFYDALESITLKVRELSQNGMPDI